MPVDENGVEIKIGVNDAEVATKFASAVGQVKAGVEKMKASMEQLHGVVDKMQKGFMAVTAMLAGGALFKDAVKETLALAGEVTSLSKKLGISREEASYLNIGLKHIGATSEEYIGITTKLNRTLRTNEESLTSLGVVTRDGNGNFANQQTILKSAMGVMMEYEEGTDRNIIAMRLFGRGADDAAKFMKLNAEIMEEAKETAQAFGLVMGQDVADNAKKLKLAMATVSTASEAIEVAIGKAAMPRLMEMASFLKANAIPIMETMSAVIGAVVDVVSGLALVVNEIKSVISEVFSSIAQIVTEVFGGSGSVAKDFNVFSTIVNVVRSLLAAFVMVVRIGFAAILLPIHQVTNTVLTLIQVWRSMQNLDIDGAVAAVKAGAKRAEEISAAHWVKLKEIAADGQAKIDTVWGNSKDEKPTTPDKKLGGHKRAGAEDDGKGKEKDVTSARLALQKAEFEAEVALIKDNNARAQALYDDAYANNLISTREYFAAKLAYANSSADKDIEAKQKEIAAAEGALAKAQAKTSPDGEKQVLKFRTELVKLTNALAILEAHRAEAGINNNTKMIEAERARVSKLASIEVDAKEKAAISVVDSDKQTADARFALGAITNLQLIELDKQFEERKSEIARAAIQARKDLEIGGINDPASVAALNAQLEQEAEKHAASMKAIAIRNAAEINRPYKAIQDSLASSLSSSIQGLLSKTVSLASAMRTILSGLGMTIIAELITKPLAAKAVAWIQEKLFNVSAIVSQAGVAGAAATASAAAIPVYGWSIAPAAGAAVSASALAYSAMSASGGYDIPRGVNPMTQLHQEEMVLPAKYADVIRQMASTGGGAAGAGGPQVTYNDHSGRLTESDIRRNTKVIADSLRDYARKQ